MDGAPPSSDVLPSSKLDESNTGASANCIFLASATADSRSTGETSGLWLVRCRKWDIKPVDLLKISRVHFSTSSTAARLLDAVSFACSERSCAIHSARKPSGFHQGKTPIPNSLKPTSAQLQ